MKILKEILKIWHNIGFYLWMEDFRKASEQCEKLKLYKARHPATYAVSLMMQIFM